MNTFSFSEIRLIISHSSKINANPPYLNSVEKSKKIISHRLNLIRTLKIYLKKYCNNAANKNNILYLSIFYLDIILSKNKISLSFDKNLKYLCLCCFLLSLKFIGNYDISKKIIKNFCHNYKEEYKIFEMQCLNLLDYNLIYTTAYDYINMILIKDQNKKLFSICSALLNQICEDNLFVCYSPFYISVAIIQIAKISINDKNYNHYDKYFHDQRVKYLYKMFNYLINPEPVNHITIEDNNRNFYEKNNHIKNHNSNHINDGIKYNNFENENYYSHNRNNNSSNINIFTNNNIHNNIVIINEYSSKNDEDNFYNNNEFSRRTCITTKNKTPINIFFNRTNISKINTNNYNNISNSEFNESDLDADNSNNKKINTSEKNNTIYKSKFSKGGIKKNNYNYSNFKITKLKEYKNDKPVYKISYFPKSSNNLPNYFPNRNYEKNTYRRRRLNNIMNKDNESKSHILSNSLNQNQIKSNSSTKRRVIYQNKSSVNFNLVSGVSKDKLVKLSRNLSKIMVKPQEKNSGKPKVNNN